MIIFIEGDLLANRYRVKAIGYGCNARGIMGAGIARAIKLTEPQNYLQYRALCERGRLKPGDVFAFEGKDFLILNLITQDGIGRDRPHAELPFIRAALQRSRAILEERGIDTFALPRIGCGLGGLAWREVGVVITEVFAEWPGTLYVYEEYIAE